MRAGRKTGLGHGKLCFRSGAVEVISLLNSGGLEQLGKVGADVLSAAETPPAVTDKLAEAGQVFRVIVAAEPYVYTGVGEHLRRFHGGVVIVACGIDIPFAGLIVGSGAIHGDLHLLHVPQVRDLPHPFGGQKGSVSDHGGVEPDASFPQTAADTGDHGSTEQRFAPEPAQMHVSLRFGAADEINNGFRCLRRHADGSPAFFVAVHAACVAGGCREDRVQTDPGGFLFERLQGAHHHGVLRKFIVVFLRHETCQSEFVPEFWIRCVCPDGIPFSLIKLHYFFRQSVA